MKYLIVFLFIANFGYSQNEKLFYFAVNDSLLGVKTENGRVIIEPKSSWQSKNYGNINLEIRTQIFPISFKSKPESYYNRKGEYLFDTYMTAEGYDSFNEGFIRYKKNKKCGLADENGNLITKPMYDYISQMNFGFSPYCINCYFDTSKDEEHPELVGGTWGYINTKGEEIVTTTTRNHPKDIQTQDNKFVPYQFSYNEKENEILNYFYKRSKEISKILKAYCEGCNTYQLSFEIVKRPDSETEFYKIKLYEILDGKTVFGSDDDDYKSFSVSSDGKKFYANYTELVNYEFYSEYITKQIAVDEWLKTNPK